MMNSTSRHYDCIIHSNDKRTQKNGAREDKERQVQGCLRRFQKRY